MRRIRVKPINGAIVTDSTGKQIPEKGVEVEKTVAVLRAIREGSLEVVKTLKKKDKEGGE